MATFLCEEMRSGLFFGTSKQSNIKHENKQKRQQKTDSTDPHFLSSEIEKLEAFASLDSDVYNI